MCFYSVDGVRLAPDDSRHGWLLRSCSNGSWTANEDSSERIGLLPLRGYEKSRGAGIYKVLRGRLPSRLVTAGRRRGNVRDATVRCRRGPVVTAAEWCRTTQSASGP